MKMRDRYLFKAKRLDNEEWVVGFYHCTNWINPQTKEIVEVTHSILPIDCQDSYYVDPSTICQCTGRKDKNKKLIWENDIVREEHGNFYKAIWQNNHYQFTWSCVKSDVFFIGAKWDLWSFEISGIEVVGNIFDNPELLD